MFSKTNHSIQGNRSNDQLIGNQKKCDPIFGCSEKTRLSALTVDFDRTYHKPTTNSKIYTSKKIFTNQIYLFGYQTITIKSRSGVSGYVRKFFNRMQKSKHNRICIVKLSKKYFNTKNYYNKGERQDSDKEFFRMWNPEKNKRNKIVLRSQVDHVTGNQSLKLLRITEITVFMNKLVITGKN